MIRGAIVALSFALFATADACASAIYPLDTFPTSGVADGPDAGLYIFATEGREIALPFRVNAPGRITEIETAIMALGGIAEPCFGASVGIVGADLLGSTYPLGFVHKFSAQRVNPEYPNCDPDAALPEELEYPLVLTGLDWFLPPGDYWLAVEFIGDINAGRWLTNDSLLSDDWATRECLGACDAWQTLEDRGRDAERVPAARITFEPGLRVSEPTSLATLAGSLLALLVVTRSRRRAC